MDQDIQAEGTRIEGYLEEDIRVCLEKNQDEYIGRFKNLPKKRFNFAAAFFSSNWFAYRLMIKEGCLFWLLETGFSVIVALITLILTFNGFLAMDKAVVISNTYFIWLFLPGRILLGLFADRVYWKKLKKVLDGAGRRNAAEPAAESVCTELKNQTGVSVFLAVIAAILLNCASAALTKYIMMPAVIWLAEFYLGR